LYFGTGGVFVYPGGAPLYDTSYVIPQPNQMIPEALEVLLHQVLHVDEHLLEFTDVLPDSA
jgi:hypothetical protein